jgi:uncharacterized protein
MERDRSNRIIAYDSARAFAVIGMIFVNTIKIMDIRRLEPSWVDRTVNLITGRAAVIFVMLAGAGMLLSYDRTPTCDKVAFRQRMLMRAALLGSIGGLFMIVWNADILHFYAAYIMLGVILLDTSTSILINIIKKMVLISLPICMVVAYEIEGGQIYETLFMVYTPSPIIDYFFLSNYYPVFPWFCFFLMGMLLGHLERSPDKRVFKQIFAVSSIIFIGIEVFSSSLNTDALAGRWVDLDNPLWRAIILSEAFPVTPLFLFSAGASGLALISLLRLLEERSKRVRWLISWVALGRMSLTFYIFHILICDAYNRWVVHQQGNASGHQAIFFAIGFIIIGTLFASVWSYCFGRGPLEFGINKLTKFLSKSVIQSWQLKL